MRKNDLYSETVMHLPVGYATGQFESLESALASQLPDDRLLDLLLFADEKEQEKHSHRVALDEEWERLRDHAGVKLMQKLTGNGDEAAHRNWRDRRVDWKPRSYKKALGLIQTLSDGQLLTLFIQASETAFLYEGRALQSRWEKVVHACRVEIRRRIAEKRPASDLETDQPDKEEIIDDFDDEGVDVYLSLREVLRIAEAAFQPEMSDAKLLDLFNLVITFDDGPDDNVFDEILTPVRDMIERRMQRGAPETELRQAVPGFDYPDDHGSALKAVLTGRLPHRNLLTIYSLAWDCDIDSPWVSIADLCKAQILRRMTPPPAPPVELSGPDYQDWTRTELARRIQSHDREGA